MYLKNIYTYIYLLYTTIECESNKTSHLNGVNFSIYMCKVRENIRDEEGWKDV